MRMKRLQQRCQPGKDGDAEGCCADDDDNGGWKPLYSSFRSSSLRPYYRSGGAHMSMAQPLTIMAEPLFREFGFPTIPT